MDISDMRMKPSTNGLKIENTGYRRQLKVCVFFDILLARKGQKTFLYFSGPKLSVSFYCKPSEDLTGSAGLGSSRNVGSYIIIPQLPIRDL